jgi:hypothetical protein
MPRLRLDCLSLFHSAAKNVLWDTFAAGGDKINSKSKKKLLVKALWL